MTSNMPGTEAKRADSMKTGAPLSRDSKLRQGALLLAVIWLVLAAVPEIPAPILPGLDPGWVLGLNMAHSQGLVHGKDIVWTYGPLGYLAYPDASGHAMYPVLVFRLGIYLLWCVAMLRLSLVAPSRMIAACVVILVGFSAILDPLMDHLGLAFFTWSLVVVVDRSKWRTAALAILAFLSALACMIKGNLGIEAACLFGSVAAIAAFQDASSRRIRWQIFGAVLLFPISTVLLYAVGTGTRGFAAGIHSQLSRNGFRLLGRDELQRAPWAGLCSRSSAWPFCFWCCPWWKDPSETWRLDFCPR